MTADPQRAAAFRRGFWQGAPMVVVIVPFALLFGILARETGLGVAEAMGFSVLVIAGASQFAAVQLLSENAPMLVVVASALIVNLRMSMYSAALTPHLGAAPVWQRGLIAYFMFDQTFAGAMADYTRDPRQSLQAKVAYFAGITVALAPAWLVATLVGATMRTAIPPELALDFAVPVTFLAIIAPMLRSVPHVVAAVVAVVVALLAAGLPYNLGLVVASVAAMLAGAGAEVAQERRAQA